MSWLHTVHDYTSADVPLIQVYSQPAAELTSRCSNSKCNTPVMYVYGSLLLPPCQRVASNGSAPDVVVSLSCRKIMAAMHRASTSVEHHFWPPSFPISIGAPLVACLRYFIERRFLRRADRLHVTFRCLRLRSHKAQVYVNLEQAKANLECGPGVLSNNTSLHT